MIEYWADALSGFLLWWHSLECAWVWIALISGAIGALLGALAMWDGWRAAEADREVV